MSANDALLTPATPIAGDAGVCQMMWYDTDGGNDMPESSGIYQIRNLNNGKCYVGSAVDISYRLRKHGELLRRGVHHSIHLQRSYNKHGEDAFAFEVLITCHPTMLIWYEQQFLDQWKPEYNILPTAGSNLGYRATAETKRKMSRSRMGNTNCLGNTLSEEHKQMIGAGVRKAYSEGRMPDKLGTTLSEEHKQKITKSLMGNQYCLGKRWTLSEDKRRHGEQMGGASKLTDEDVINIRKRLATGETREAIAADYPVSNATIGHIKQGRTWKHLL